MTELDKAVKSLKKKFVEVVLKQIEWNGHPSQLGVISVI